MDFGYDVERHMLDKVFEDLSVPGRLSYGLMARMARGHFYF
jgi:hypothetical protein